MGLEAKISRHINWSFQVKDMQDMEARFNEQIQALRNERNALQKDADSVPTLKAEIAELQNKVHTWKFNGIVMSLLPSWLSQIDELEVDIQWR